MLATLSLVTFFFAAWLVRDHLLAIQRNGKRLKRPPGTLPFAGYGLWFLQPRHVLLDWFGSIQSRMGLETYELPIPSLPPAVLINSPVILEQVLKDTTVFIKGRFFRTRTEDLFRDGILNADGELWKVQRKAGLRFLSTSNIQCFIDEVLPPLLDDVIISLDDAASESMVVDLQEILLSLTTRFMGKIAYDLDITNDMPFARAFEYASAEIGYRFTNPLWKIKYLFFGQSLRKAVGEIHDFGASIVDAAKRTDGNENEDELVQGRRASGLARKANLVRSLIKHIPSSNTVSAAAMNYLSAGRDTTAQSFAWTFNHLMRNPDKMSRLRASMILDSTENETLTYETARNHKQMAYLNAVFAESLRLSPPIPLEIKETTRAVVLADGTSLPSGAVVVWSPYAMARNPRIWGKDATIFRPERWLNGVHETLSYKFQHGDEQERWHELDLSDAEFVPNLKTAFENPVFNGGPRACIGKHLAETLGVVVISRLVSTFNFEIAHPEHSQNWQAVGQDGLTMSIKNGLQVKVKRISPRIVK